MTADNSKRPASLLEKATTRPPPTKAEIRAYRARTGINAPAFKIGKHSISKKDLMICAGLAVVAPFVWLLLPSPPSQPQSLAQKPSPVKPLPPGADWNKLLHPNNGD